MSDLSNSRYKYQEDPVSFFVLKNLWTKNMIISSRNQLLLRNISYKSQKNFCPKIRLGANPMIEKEPCIQC
ncbi:hypothetical protein P618_200743 [Holospora obtusa F1]|uniref:Uncharacterized protein n=1 Tax=Holospora obtusa F1 TaxID=1399147 RepID=W6TTE8_HOLOB|nr:hypothetical protein [Holospora obtusa]ETZ07062.1 hypothetical protein P618_200743 [Holospora obtusa F1]